MAPQFLGTDVMPASLPHLEQGLDIDATQLQSLLNREFLRGKDLLAQPHPHGRARSTPPSLTSQSFLLFRSGPPGDPFSLDECRSLVALMDVSFAVTIHPPLPPSTESLSAPSSSPRI